MIGHMTGQLFCVQGVRFTRDWSFVRTTLELVVNKKLPIVRSADVHPMDRMFRL